MTSLVFAPAALADLEAIAHTIAEDNPERARSFVVELRTRARQILETPNIFPSRDELAPGLRAARHGRYLLFFICFDDAVTIVRVLHSARDLRPLFAE